MKLMIGKKMTTKFSLRNKADVSMIPIANLILLHRQQVMIVTKTQRMDRMIIP